MFLEIFTLLLLAAVLGVKYATTVHTVKLQQKLAEAGNLAHRNQERYKRISQERQSVEAEEAQAQSQKRVLTEHLDGLQMELKDQEGKNQDLTERIEGAK